MQNRDNVKSSSKTVQQKIAELRKINRNLKRKVSKEKRSLERLYVLQNEFEALQANLVELYNGVIPTGLQYTRQSRE